MKIKPVSLLIAFALLCLVSNPRICFSNQDPIIISGSSSYKPFYYQDAQGNVTGLFADFWKLWAQKMGQEIQFETKPFAQALKYVDQGGADVVAGFFHNTERSKRFLFSKPFYEIPTHIFFHKQVYGLKGLNDLKGFSIGIVKGDYAQGYVRQHFPDAALAFYDQFDDLVNAAVDGEIKVFICDTPVALFLLSKHGRADDFKHSTQPLYSSKIFAGVKKNNQALLNLINTGIDRISTKELANIDRNWQGIRVQKAFPWAIIGMVFGVISILTAVLALWNYQLRRRVAIATSDISKQQQLLAEHEKSLLRGNEELEIRVYQRTLQMTKANQLLAEQIDKHSQTEKRLAKHNAYLFALHDTMLGLMRRLDLQELLEAVVNRVTAATGSEHGYIYLKDESSGELVARFGTGLFTSASGYRLKPGQGLAGKVLVNKRHLLVEDYQNWEGRHPDSHWDGLGAVIGIPLTSGTEVVGVIGLCFMQSEGAFNEDEITFLNGFAELASIALDNSQLYEDLQSELNERKRAEIERKRLEERVQQAQKMEAVGTLAGGIAHDFNNILAVIMGNLELAMEDTSKNSPVQNYLQDGFQSSIRARDLIQQILTFSRKGTLETLPAKVEPIVAQGIKLIRASIPASIEIRQHLDAEDAVIKASTVQIHQVLMNLSANAAHAMEEDGGHLDFQLIKTELDGDFCAQNPDIRPGGYVQLTIRDSGHGISPDIMPRIFEPYFTTKEMERGTGLGLSVVHGIVKSHHGLITANSRLGQGTKFDIYLPLSDGILPSQSKTVDSNICGTESILLVDDEAELLTIGRKALENLGYKVTTCADGQTALDTFKKTPNDFDLVITDMTMPRLNGDKLSIEILNLMPETPIIMCTGFSHLISKEKARQIGIRSLLMKPVFMGDLSTAIRSVLTSPAPSSDSAFKSISQTDYP